MYRNLPAQFWMQAKKMPSKVHPNSQVTTPEVVSGVSESVVGSSDISAWVCAGFGPVSERAQGLGDIGVNIWGYVFGGLGPIVDTGMAQGPGIRVLDA